jgi:hypothetical protein
MESDFGDTLDTTCDNLNNVFAFTGIMIGIATNSGFSHALIPYTLLGVGGSLIFYFIYFPKWGKGSFFHGTWIYNLIQHLASRNFVYIASFIWDFRPHGLVPLAVRVRVQSFCDGIVHQQKKACLIDDISIKLAFKII